MADSWNKREREKKKRQSKKEKAEKKLERKEHTQQGKSLEDMMAYVDEDGNLSTVPPDPDRKTEVKLEDIQIGVPKKDELTEEELVHTGIVTSYNESRGFGFIRDLETAERVFVHVHSLKGPIREGSKVEFEIEMSHKGPNAIHVSPVG